MDLAQICNEVKMPQSEDSFTYVNSASSILCYMNEFYSVVGIIMSV
jgi:hypothetical protein